jgi:hypothetical protein
MMTFYDENVCLEYGLLTFPQHQTSLQSHSQYPQKKSQQTTLESLILSIKNSFPLENQNISFNSSYLKPQIPLFFYKFSYAYVPISALYNSLGVRVIESHLSHGNQC